MRAAEELPLLLPNAQVPIPAAAMIHGSGDSDRDNLWHLAIADHLARNGIAVLLPDKRPDVLELFVRWIRAKAPAN